MEPLHMKQCVGVDVFFDVEIRADTQVENIHVSVPRDVDLSESDKDFSSDIHARL